MKRNRIAYFVLLAALLWPAGAFAGPVVADRAKQTNCPKARLLDDIPLQTIITFSGTGARVAAGFNVSLDIEHPSAGDLRVTLTSPKGTIVTLRDWTSPGGKDIKGVFPGSLTPVKSLGVLTGEPLDGDWVLTILDANTDSGQGMLNCWGISGPGR